MKEDARGPSVAEALGQVAWLLSQSPTYRELKLRDLEAVFLPPIMAGQFRIFRIGQGALAAAAGPDQLPAAAISGLEQAPLGVAIWAQLSLEAEARLEGGERLASADWTSGDRTWLIELVVPFSTPENHLQDVALMDLLRGPLGGREVRLHHSDPSTGQRRTVVLPVQQAA